MRFNIAVLPGDGIGQEVMAEGIKVLKAVGQRFGHSFQFYFGVVGGAAIDQYGVALLPETLEMCRACDAVLFGAVGGPKWDDPKASVRPEQAILGLRKGLNLFANLRPVKVFPTLVNASTLKREIVEGVDILFVRELTGGIYFGRPQKRWSTTRGRRAVDTLAYSQGEIERILRVAFELARGRRRHLTVVDKANILESSRLWREVTEEVARENPDVEQDYFLVDACSMHLLRRPRDFDVVVTENMFGDILTDEASMLSGSMGMLPSASLGQGKRGRGGRLTFPTLGLYEPIHGTAPDIAGQNKANPLAIILSVALLLRFSCGLDEAATAVEEAVNQVLEEDYRTGDIMSPEMKQVGTVEMGDLVVSKVQR
ncbi:MAG: 3-isopropylmalate dehydrogenase [Chloroflexi bacterium]|nr:3-isopropylmalate dehydrogenase [Chloroflexota bacterium]